MPPHVDRAVTDDTALTGVALADTDLFPMVDVSDTTDAATGTDKSMTAAELRAGLIKLLSTVVADGLRVAEDGSIQVGDGGGDEFHYQSGELRVSGAMTALGFEGSGAELTDLPWVPARVFYASRISGVVLDADPDNNTGTDNTALLQAVLNGGNVHLIIDGPCLFDTLLYESYTILECVGDGLLFRKGQPNGGRNCLMNANPVMGPGTPIDTWVVLRNVRLDGNRRNNGSGNTGTGPFNSAFQQAVMNDDGHGVVGIGLFGVTRFLIQDTEVTNPPAYGLYIGNSDGFIDGFAKWKAAGDVQPTDCVIQFGGWNRTIIGRRIRGTTVDDGFGFTANDGQDDPGATTGPEPGLVAPGPISGVHLKDIDFSGGVKQVARFLSAAAANSITNVTIENVVATLGGEGGFGFAGFQFDDFNLTGPLTDGTHGWIDGVTIKNVTLTGNHIGTFGVVHFGACRFGRVTVDGLRTRMNSSPVANAVKVDTTATGDTLVLNGVVNESLIAGVDSVKILGPVRSVLVDGCEYDQYVAGANLPHAWTSPAAPYQSFYPTSLVRVQAAVDVLMVRGCRTAGIAEVVRCVGVAPKSIVVGGVSHQASKGGAVVRSDTVLPNVVLYGLDAERATEVPAGSVVKYLGTDLSPIATVNLRCSFLENNSGSQHAAGTTLPFTVSENGVGWNLPIAGTGNVRVTATGTAFGDAPCILNVDTPGRPTSDTFDVEFDIVRRTVVAPGDWVYLQFFADAGGVTTFAGFTFDSTSLSIRQNNATVVQTTASVPAVGVVWRIRCRVTAVGTTRTIKTYVSTDAGRTWASLLSDAVFTIAQPKTLAIYTLGTSASATTGNHVGGITVTSYTNPPSTGTLTPPTLSANQNNYTPGTARYLRVATDGAGARTITGLAAGVESQEMAVINVSASDTITLSHQSGSSTSTNRFLNVTGADVVLAAGGRADLVYDAVTGRWRVY